MIKDSLDTTQALKEEIRRLNREIKSKRFELDDTSKGNIQALRNTLSEHREYQLAYQRTSTEVSY